jgi:hypothetical protein
VAAETQANVVLEAVSVLGKQVVEGASFARPGPFYQCAHRIGRIHGVWHSTRKEDTNRRRVTRNLGKSGPPDIPGGGRVPSTAVIPRPSKDLRPAMARREGALIWSLWEGNAFLALSGAGSPASR